MKRISHARNRKSIKMLAVFLVASILLSLTQRQWCCVFRFHSIDACWILDSNFGALKRGYSNLHLLIFLFSVLIKYGFTVIFGAWLIFALLGKTIRQNALLLSFSSIIAIMAGEVSLRTVGYNPGQFTYSPWAHPVDSLVELRGFTADNEGITKIDTLFVNQILASAESTLIDDSYRNKCDTCSAEVIQLYLDHGILANKTDSNDEFWTRYKSIETLKDSSSNSKLFTRIAENPVNVDGFYSIPFDTIGVTGKRILLLGDSFTWGHTADPKTKSFANLLLARNYMVYNTGISGADVVQYGHILNLYHNKIRPDIVILNFFMGNDVSYFERIPKPRVPIHFSTNAGNILSFQAGVQFDFAQTAYQNVTRNMVIPSTTFINKLCSKTVLSSLIWERLVHLELIENQFFTKKNIQQTLLWIIRLSRLLNCAIV